MQEGNFELDKQGWYTPIIVEENSWLNDKQSPADLAKFGKNYSVVFEGDAQTYLWTTKTAPEIGKRYWGHMQATSGKSIRFKTDKQDNAGPTGVGIPAGRPLPLDADRDDSIARAVALKAAVEHVGYHKGPSSKVLSTAELFLKWLKSDSGVQPVGAQGTTAPGVRQEATSAAPAAGYDKAMAWADKLRQPQDTPEPPEDLQDLIDFAGGPDEDY